MIMMSRQSLTQFVALDNSRLSSLHITCPDIADDLIDALAKSAPNLKIIRLHIPVYSGAIVKNFNFVEVLQISTCIRPDSYKDIVLQGGSFNPKLIELKFRQEFPYEMRFLNKCVADYPNLRKLTLGRDPPVTTLQMELLHNVFPKIESVQLGGF